MEREVERRALADGTFGPDAAAVAMDDPLHRRQADPGALELGLVVQPLERSEQLVGVRHVESRAVVADEVGARPVRSVRPTSTVASGSSSELPGVSQQVFERETQQLTIADVDEARPNPNFDLAVRVDTVKLGRDRLGDFREIYGSWTSLNESLATAP